MIKPLTDREQTLIINNIVKACTDIHKLNRTGYKYLYLCSGFIAHYNLQGFISNYDIVDCGYNLRDAILANHQNNQWNNFSPKDNDYNYYMTKKNVYNRIVDKLKNQELQLWNT